MKNIKNQSFFIAMMVCCILVVVAVVAYAVCGTVVMETSIPSLQRVEINDMSLRYKRDIDARVWLKTRFNIPSQINADPLLGTFVLSTKVDKNVTLRSFTETGYKMSTLDQLMLLQFKMSGIHSGDDKGVMWMRLDGEFKVQVKLAHFPLFPKSVRHVAFTCDVSFKKSDPEEMDKKNKFFLGKQNGKKPVGCHIILNMIENLQLAHQELSVIIDLINTVEANDAVTVAGMTRPKQLPNELLSDLAVSTATKLQCFRKLGKYFNQSAKSLEKQVAREARFYGALIRLRQSWKIKRHRMAATAAGNEGFYIDLFDNTLFDPKSVFCPSSLSTVRVEHDNAGMLALNLSSKACHTLQFGFVNQSFNNILKRSNTKNSDFSPGQTDKEAEHDDIVKRRHSNLREVHRAVFDEQVFNLINQEAFVLSLGVNVTGIRENHLQLNIDQEASVFISLVTSPSTEDGDTSLTDGEEKPKQSYLPNRISSEIFLKQLFHDHVFVLAKNTSLFGQPPKNGSNLLGHFCMSLAHRIFSSKVLTKLEDLAMSVPCVRLMSHPTWHSRTSTWTLVVDIPQSILHTSYYVASSSQFLTKVVVNDDCITLEGEGAPNAVGIFKGKSENSYSINRFECNLADLHVILLQQVASQIIRWLHEEALIEGMKASRDFLSLSFELDQGEVVGLAAQVDPEDSEGGISWWLVAGNETAEEEYKLQREDLDGETKRFLGHLSLDVLYATLLDLVTMCNNNAGSL